MTNIKQTPPDDVFLPGAMSGKMWALLVAAYLKGEADIDMHELFAVNPRPLTYSVQEYLGYRFAGMNRALERRNSAFRIKPGRIKGSYALTLIH